MGYSWFNKILRSYYYGAIGVLLCYDVNNRESFDNLKYWIQEIHEYSRNTVNIFLIGLQKNLRSSTLHSVSPEEGKAFAKENNYFFIEIDNTDEEQVNKMFNMFSSNILKKIEKFQLVPSRHIGIVKYLHNSKPETIKCELFRNVCIIL